MRIWERERKEGEGEREGVCVTYRPSWKWRVLHKSLPFFVLAPPIFFIFYLFSLFTFTNVFRTPFQLKTGSNVSYEAIQVNLFCYNICKVFRWALEKLEFWGENVSIFLSSRVAEKNNFHDCFYYTVQVLNDMIW